MAVSLEEVEKLREKSGASYEACKDALERSGGDMLDAIIYLEKFSQSNTPGKGYTYTTRPVESAEETVKRVFTQSDDRQKGKGKSKAKETDWREWAREVGEMGMNLLRNSTVNQLEVWRNDKLMTSVPILILVLLLVLAFWITVPLIIVGLFMGCRYRFVGPDLGKEKINDVMDNVSATVDDMVGQVKREFNDGKAHGAEKAKKAERAANKVERQLDELSDHLDKAADKIDKAFTYKYEKK